MEHEEILEKAIQKAIAGGWKQPWSDKFVGIDANTITGEWFVYWSYRDLTPYKYSITSIIFNHQFAKALWGTESKLNNLPELWLEDWEFHLQNMVISDDPIKYLGENI